MASKADRLRKRAVETVRTASPKRLFDAEPARKKKSYKIVAVTLNTDDAGWVDDLAQRLRRSGMQLASRSYVVQEAVRRLREDHGEMSLEDITKSFGDRQAKRARASLTN